MKMKTQRSHEIKISVPSVKLPQQAVEEFRHLIKKEFNLNVTPEIAQQWANEWYFQVKSVYKPIPKKGISYGSK